MSELEESLILITRQNVKENRCYVFLGDQNDIASEFCHALKSEYNSPHDSIEHHYFHISDMRTKSDGELWKEIAMRRKDIIEKNERIEVKKNDGEV